jgi:bifunctional non-homologous end joining protein LigD
MLYTPQLATLVKQVPRGDAWLHEMKYDGYRIGCLVHDGRVTLLSRRGNDWTAQLPEIVAGVGALGVTHAVIDGEVAALDRDGRTSFQLLQNAFGGGPRPPLAYFVFDLLSLDGEDLTGWPLEERKAALEAIVAQGRSSVVCYATHVVGDGARVLAAACQGGLEGIVSKRRDAPYEAGRRPTWLKTKCSLRQEFVVCGVLDRVSSGGRDVGALVLGLYQDGELVYAGKVGTGFTQKSAREIRDRLRPLEQDACPFRTRPAGFTGRDTHWVRPELVCEVELTEFTDSGHVRHPSFAGLRLDKRATEVVRERPADTLAAVRQVGAR